MSRVTRNRRRHGGFSLVEVCLAVLVVGLGILSVITLFPTGLAASKSAGDDTAIALFAEGTLSGIQAKATDVPREKWNDHTQFLPAGIVLDDDDLNDLNTVAYRLSITSATGPVDNVKEVTLHVLPWRAPTLPRPNSIVSNGIPFYTEIFMMELP